MKWKVEITKSALKDLRKIDSAASSRILSYVEALVVGAENPRDKGKALLGNLSGIWSYRVLKYRILVEFDGVLGVVRVLKIAHRREVYRE